MRDGLFDEVPADRRDAVAAALKTAFAGQPVTAVATITGGASGASALRLEIADRAYVMRLERGRDFFRDPARSFVCMETACTAGVAPRLHYADAAAGIAIMDCVAQRPLSDYPGGAPGLLRALGDLLRRLQQTPAFPPLADYAVLLDGMLRMVRGSSLFAPGALDAHAEGFLRIRAAYPWAAAASVSSHNDVNPRNVLFDGERLWLVDWELAFRNDPLVDVALAVNELAPTVELQRVLLESWRGGPLDDATRARFELMRLLGRLYYGCLILSQFAALPRERPDSLDAPSVAEFTRQIGDGSLKPGTPEVSRVFGKMSLAGFLAGMQAPEFGEWLRTARG